MEKQIVSKTEEFVEDPRYKQCNKEALLCLGLGIANMIWWFVFGYGLGSVDPANYTYIMGFPTWFFMSCILGSIVFTLLVIVMVRKIFKDMPLDDVDKYEGEEVNKND